MCSARAAARRDLPIPGSPEISTICTFALPGEALAFPQEVELVLASQRDGDVFLYAFDLLELNGDDLRRDPLQVRKDALASILAKARPGQSTLRGVRISAGGFERRAPA
jgi:hypothetical protein